jgi:high-affinity nickel-transport protein
VALLLVAGGLTLVEGQMPPRLQLVFELLVAVMIVALGVRAIGRAVREGREGPHHAHEHGGVHHTHAAPDAHLHLDRWTVATRPLVVGLLHGLAGSGALTALVFAELPSLGERLGYIALFGAGSVVGMGLLTGLAGLPLLRASRKPQTAAAILGLAGVASVVVGLWWGFASGRELLG